MKKLASLFVITATLFTAHANAQSQQTVSASDVAAATISCMTINAPQDWTGALAWVDRSDTNKLTVGNLVSAKNSKELSPLATCSPKTQGLLIGMFIQFIPADQKDWKQLFFRAEPDGKFSVYTDIAIAKNAK